MMMIDIRVMMFMKMVWPSLLTQGAFMYNIDTMSGQETGWVVVFGFCSILSREILLEKPTSVETR